MTGAARIPLRDRAGDVQAWTIVDAEDYAWLARWEWRLDSGGYAVRGRKVGGREGEAFVFLLHRVIMDLPHGCTYEVDHINGDKLDNRRANLRVVTRQQNAQNHPGRTDRELARGVHWYARGGKWQARVTIDGHGHHLGYFDDYDEARATVVAYRAEHMPFATERGA